MTAAAVKRDVAVVLSGGAVNGLLMELGFLKRLRETELWPRIGWIYGTSSGAVTGVMAALDRLDELEEFMLRLQPEDTFRPHSLWRLPLLGSHDFRLPVTIDERLGGLTEIARDLAECPVEVVVFATDVSQDVHGSGPHAYELSYSSRSTPPETMAQAVLASAAVSALVLPRQVGDRIATDGAWVRNFPLGHAYHQAGVDLIVSFRYLPRYPRFDTAWLERLRRRLDRFPKVPPVRALIAELKEAEQRDARGEPAHWGDMIVRLMRVTVQQNTMLEERSSREKDAELAVLSALRDDVDAIVRREGGRRGERIARAVAECFAAAEFPFLGDRLIPRIAVQGTAGEITLETGLRHAHPWPEDEKLELISRGYALLDDVLADRAVA
jgi:predicted acylesterase/phospholipase RssA